MRFRLRLILVLFLGVSACSDEGKNAVARACYAGPARMVSIAGGDFMQGESPRNPEEGPPHNVRVAPFEISNHEVTNAEFAAFVRATGYRTKAEVDPPKLPGAPPDMLLPGSAVFAPPTRENPAWWRWVVGADWRHPEGPESTIVGKDRDPVVQVAPEDAQAYATWKGLSLPSEAEWEFAARAGAATMPEPVDEDGKPVANYYQGAFPAKDTGVDGFTSRAPVGCFGPNGFGLYDMIGNVWELTTDKAGPDGNFAVIKGGSYLCASNYCARYRPAARQFQEYGLGVDHVGFRLVKRGQ